MIYLTTGANGAGKTLLTLQDVRNQQLKENRPVYYHGFTPLQPIIDFGWLPFDPKKWQELPDGSICVMDECQNEFPARKGGDTPDYITAIAQDRRKRGFDFWMIAPHPMLVDVFIRRLVSTPSWHRHLKRAFGADMVSVLQWPTPNAECEKPAAGDSGVVTMRAFPKEVYGWYKSASLHTGKKKIPFRVWVFLACSVAAPLLVWFAYSKFTGALSSRDSNVAKLAGKDVSVPQPRPQLHRPGDAPAERKVLTPGEYAASFQPRIAGLPHTAPRYDELDRPVQVPKPAACLDGTKPGSGVRSCTCWSQQATVLQVPADLCRQIAAGGYFDDTLPPPRHQESRPLQASQSAMATQATAEPRSLQVMAASPILPPPDTHSTVERDGEVLKLMRKRSYIQ